MSFCSASRCFGGMLFVCVLCASYSKCKELLSVGGMSIEVRWCTYISTWQHITLICSLFLLFLKASFWALYDFCDLLYVSLECFHDAFWVPSWRDWSFVVSVSAWGSTPDLSQVDVTFARECAPLPGFLLPSFMVLILKTILIAFDLYFPNGAFFIIIYPKKTSFFLFVLFPFVCFNYSGPIL